MGLRTRSRTDQIGAPRTRNAHELKQDGRLELHARRSGRPGPGGEQEPVSAPLNRPAYRTSPVEKVSIPPRVTNRALKISPVTGPGLMFCRRSSPNPR